MRGYLTRLKYQRMLIEHILAQEEARDLKERKRVERWILEKETEQLQMQIEARNRLFKSLLNRQVQAAIIIQRAYRSHLRLKYRGISTTQLLEQKRKENWRDSQLMKPYLLFDDDTSDLM